MERLISIGIFERQLEPAWGSPTFIIPKSDQMVIFLTDFREMNKRIVRTPIQIPKISSTPQEMDGFTFATAIDLNMEYYISRLDPDA